MSSLTSALKAGLGWSCRFVFGAGGSLFFLAADVRCQEVGLPDATSRILTNIYEIWEMPQEERSRPYRMQTEVVIYYIDPEWRNAWGECRGRATYLPIFDSPTPLRAGQRVAIDATVVPTQERFVWDASSRVRILEENLVLPSVPVGNLADDPLRLKSHRISVEGLIDRLMEDPTHISLNFLTGGAAATVFVLKDSVTPRFKAGDFVRMNCVFAPQFDRDGNLSEITLWVARPADIQTIDSLETDSRFAGPVVLSETIRDDTPTNGLLHVRGVVRSHEAGKWITLWDASGQVMVQSGQTQPLRFGDHVEAVGYPGILGVQKILRGGLYRRIPATNLPAAEPEPSETTRQLRLAEQVRDLSLEEAKRRFPVSLHAIVTWSHQEVPFAYVQDASGGIRVANPKWEGPDAWKPGTIVNVRGEVAEGDFVPILTNAVLSRAGWWNLEPGRLVTLEQALTGVEDGRWVEMRGFVRQVAVTNGLVRLELSTSGGEFQAWVPATQSYDYLRGSIIRVQGVCGVIANARHQLTGIQMWVPDVKYLQIEEAAPDDLFAGPLRSPGNLRRFNFQNALNQRVRVAGTVVLHTPGRYLYVQEGADSVFALSQQPEPLQAGDRVEVVGFPGNQGNRFLLREAIYRRLSQTNEPAPIRLGANPTVNVESEGLLAQAQGILLSSVATEEEIRLLIRSGDSLFEAVLDSADDGLGKLERGSLLALTGVYEVRSDEYGRPHSLGLRLRSADDIRLIARPPWWTLARLLWALLGVVVVSVLAVVWGLLIARKNALLQQAHLELQRANDLLEQRVRERTAELQEQVAAKESALADLARAQKSLMLASRQAGMADVATGVLHNVGNVLNSINVSAGLVTERLDRSSLNSVSKVAALLEEHKDELGRFMTEDPKGRALPAYLRQLADVLAQDKRGMQEEIASLIRNLEHIKGIVAMHESHAKVVDMAEEVVLPDLVEEAVQINAAVLDSNQVELARDFQPVPPVVTDRHKVLQILIHLISNATEALSEIPSSRKLVLAVGPAEPDRVRISVSDNGIGIEPGNLNRIFSQGFTTWRGGHGFGLHSSANSAKELGGSLTVHSDGPGCGATFILSLPVGKAP